MFALVGTEVKMDRMENLANAIYGMTANELQVLGALMHAERTTRKSGWRYYQKVYVRFAGSSDRNYLSNFMVGRVLYADKETVRIVGATGRIFVSLINEKVGNTLYTVDQFRELKNAMVDANKRVDPFKPVIREKVAELDDVPDEKITNPKVRRLSSRKDDLVSIFSRMSRGVIGRTSKKKKVVGTGEIAISWG